MVYIYLYTCCIFQECEKLAKENAAITGHQNVRQRIQYHATVKVENAKLKEVRAFVYIKVTFTRAYQV